MQSPRLVCRHGSASMTHGDCVTTPGYPECTVFTAARPEGFKRCRTQSRILAHPFEITRFRDRHRPVAIPTAERAQFF